MRVSNQMKLVINQKEISKSKAAVNYQEEIAVSKIYHNEKK